MIIYHEVHMIVSCYGHMCGLEKGALILQLHPSSLITICVELIVLYQAQELLASGVIVLHQPQELLTSGVIVLHQVQLTSGVIVLHQAHELLASGVIEQRCL